MATATATTSTPCGHPGGGLQGNNAFEFPMKNSLDEIQDFKPEPCLPNDQLKENPDSSTETSKLPTCTPVAKKKPLKKPSADCSKLPTFTPVAPKKSSKKRKMNDAVAVGGTKRDKSNKNTLLKYSVTNNRFRPVGLSPYPTVSYSVPKPLPILQRVNLDSFPHEKKAAKFADRFLKMAEGTSVMDQASLLSHTVRFMEQQRIFADAGRPTEVSIGYHYIPKQDLVSVNVHGLMSSSECWQKNMRGGHVGRFGDGIYMAPHLHYYSNVDDVGIMVAVLKGKRSRVGPGGIQRNDLDTVVGNKMLYDWTSPSLQPLYFDEIVAKRGSQCLPLFFFSANQVDEPNHAALRSLSKYHVDLQRMLDESFNDGRITTLQIPITEERIPKIHVSHRVTMVEHQPVLEQKSDWDIILPYCAPAAPSTGITGSGTDLGPLRLVVPTIGDDEDCCFLCLKRLIPAASPCSSCAQCSQNFHRCCADLAMKPTGGACPGCRSKEAFPPGKCPSGVMTVHFTKEKRADVFTSSGTYVVTYEVFDGVQELHHVSPGKRFEGAKLRTYVPQSEQGDELLKRLKWAWMNGLMFTIGMTAGDTDHITLKLRTLRTTIDGCDSKGYITNCNNELDRLGVPRATALVGVAAVATLPPSTPADVKVIRSLWMQWSEENGLANTLLAVQAKGIPPTPLSRSARVAVATLLPSVPSLVGVGASSGPPSLGFDVATSNSLAPPSLDFNETM
jgi:hypothetical protein